MALGRTASCVVLGVVGGALSYGAVCAACLAGGGTLTKETAGSISIIGIESAFLIGFGIRLSFGKYGELARLRFLLVMVVLLASTPVVFGFLQDAVRRGAGNCEAGSCIDVPSWVDSVSWVGAFSIPAFFLLLLLLDSALRISIPRPKPRITARTFEPILHEGERKHGDVRQQVVRNANVFLEEQRRRKGK